MATEAGPSITVIVPTRNRWKLLGRAVATALGQRDVELEVVVVDGASSDETRRWLEAQQDPRIRYLREAVAGGVSRARNRGMAAARAQWIAFLDDDDAWAPDKLSRQLAAVRARAAEWTYSGAVRFTSEGRITEVLEAPDPAVLRSHLTHGATMPAPASNLLARRELLERAGGFDERLGLLADWDLWIRLAELAQPALSPGLLVGYRTHPGQMTAMRAREALAEFEYVRAKHRDKAIDLGLADYLSWLAYEQRSSGRRVRALGTYVRAAWATRQAGPLRAAAGLLTGRPAVTGRELDEGQGKPELEWLRQAAGSAGPREQG
jgi:glycosyltransferase involved in cell wall biosynthesis